MLMRTPSGALVDIEPEAVERYVARGFRPVDDAPKNARGRDRKTRKAPRK